MGSLIGIVQEGFAGEAAYEARMRSWGGTFGAKDTPRREAVDSTHPFSQEGRCPFTTVTARKVCWGLLPILSTLETNMIHSGPIWPHGKGQVPMPACSSPTQLASFFPFSFFFQSWVQTAKCCPCLSWAESTPHKGSITSLAFFLPVFSSTYFPTVMAQEAPAPPRGVFLENKSFAHAVPCSLQAQSSSTPTQVPVPTAGSALFLTAALLGQTCPRVTPKPRQGSRAQGFLCVPLMGRDSR